MRPVFVLKPDHYTRKTTFPEVLNFNRQEFIVPFSLSLSLSLSLFLRPPFHLPIPPLYRHILSPYLPSCPIPSQILRDIFPLLYWVLPFLILKQDFWDVFTVQVVLYVFNVTEVRWSSPH